MITSAFVGSVDLSLSDFVPRPSIHFVARLSTSSPFSPPKLLTTVAHQRKKTATPPELRSHNDYSSERRLYPYLAL